MNRQIAPGTAEEYFAESEKFQDTWQRVTHAITKMRTEGVSLSRSARGHGLDARTVIRLGRPALRKLSNGRYAVRDSDRLLRVLTVITPKGLKEVATRDSRQASLAAMHSAAVQHYLQTGDESALRKLPRKTLTDADGKRVRLLTKLEELDRLGNAGVLSFESLYARSA